MSELRPCPFCGGEASRVYTDDHPKGERKVHIECDICNARSDWQYTRASSADVWWNTRVDDAKLKLAVEALEHYADQDRWVCDEMSEHYPSGRTLYAPDHDATPAFGYTAAADALAKIGEQR